MKGLVLGVALAVSMTPAAQAQAPPAQPAPPPASAPGAPQKPAPAQQPEAPAPPPRPFPEGAKIAYVVLQRVASESADGKAAAAQIQGLQQKKAGEINEKNKQLQGLQQRLEKEASVLSTTAQAELQRQIERTQVEIQRMTQDAQQEINDLQAQLQQQFQVRIEPVLAAIGQEKGLHFIFNAQDSGLVWADTGLDITVEIIKRLDATGAKPPGK